MRTLIIEDEPSELLHLQQLLANNYFPRVEIVGTAGNGQEGLELVASLQPDLVLLCMHLPDEQALELLHLLSHGRFALLCLQPAELAHPLALAAADCLRKPLTVRALAGSLYLAMKQWREEQIYATLLKLTDILFRKRITMPMGSESVVVYLSDILHCRADNSYTHFYLTGERVQTVAKGLSYFVEELEKNGFVKASRSAMVNIDHVSSFSWKDNVHELILLDRRTRIHVPRNCMDRVLRRLQELTGTKWK